MWQCSGTINGLSVDTEIQRERTKRRQRYKEMTGGTDESRDSRSLDLDRLTARISIIVSLFLFFFLLFCFV